jgi:D-alanine-D-alanine ligase-like ATP-grasp enzyme
VRSATVLSRRALGGECLEKATSVKQVTRRIREGFDLFFNLCDGAADQTTPGIEVVKTLEEHGVAFTGATSEFYEPSRQAMKLACRAEGIDTPDYVLARCEADVELAAHVLRFPMIVKHYSSYSSVIFPGAPASVRRPGCTGRHARSSVATERR